MPVQELQNQAGPASLIGLVGGYLAGNPARKRAQAQREFEQKRETAADQRAAQELANNTLEATDRHTASVDTQTQLAAKNLAHAQEAKVIGAEPPYDPQNPNAWLGWAMKASHYYATSDPEYAKSLAEQVRYGANPLGQEARATRDVAGAGLDKARTQQILQWKTRADYAFKQKMQELQATANGRAQIAGMNQAAAYARAQLSQGGAMARAQMSEQERTLIAEMTALNAANDHDMNRAFQTAKVQYEAQLKGWQDQQTAGAAAAAKGNDTSLYPQFGQPAPTFSPNISVSTGGGQPIIVMLPNPAGGAPIPVVSRPPNGSGRPPKPPGGGPPADMKPGTVEAWNGLDAAGRAAWLSSPKIPEDVKAYLKTLPAKTLPAPQQPGLGGLGSFIQSLLQGHR